jgi:4-hydroxy-3-polyprenylbenzoate decarboxylase
MKKTLVVGITGASGSVYGKRLVQTLLRMGHDCHLIVSPAGRSVITYELEEDFSSWPARLEYPAAWEL